MDGIEHHARNLKVHDISEGAIPCAGTPQDWPQRGPLRTATEGASSRTEREIGSNLFLNNFGG
jgi:hypothetical protein